MGPGVRRDDGSDMVSDTIEQPTAEGEAPAVARMNMIQAINSALDVVMARDADVMVMGEDVGYFGGVFRATAGLQAKYGKTRVFDTPITEIGIIGVAIGMGAYGLRPVPEIQFADYIYPALTSWSARRRGCAIGRRVISPRRSRCARPMAAASSAARRIRSRRKASSRTCPASRR
jgi:hypothetical protein